MLENPKQVQLSEHYQNIIDEIISNKKNRFAIGKGDFKRVSGEVVELFYQKFFEALKTNTSITSLQLDALLPKHAPALFAALEANSTIQHLDLSGNYESLNLESAEAFKHYLQNNATLHSLEISNWQYSDEVAIAIVDGLKANKGVCNLHSGYSPIHTNIGMLEDIMEANTNIIIMDHRIKSENVGNLVNRNIQIFKAKCERFHLIDENKLSNEELKSIKSKINCLKFETENYGTSTAIKLNDIADGILVKTAIKAVKAEISQEHLIADLAEISAEFAVPNIGSKEEMSALKAINFHKERYAVNEVLDIILNRIELIQQERLEAQKAQKSAASYSSASSVSASSSASSQSSSNSANSSSSAPQNDREQRRQDWLAKLEQEVKDQKMR